MNLTTYVLVLMIGGSASVNGEYTVQLECEEHLVELALASDRKWKISKTDFGSVRAHVKLSNESKLEMYCTPLGKKLSDLP